MLNEQNLHNYQRHCVQHIIDHPGSALFLEMGLGKSVTTLTALDKLIFDYLECGKTLIIAPKFVAEHTWSTEIENWEHLKHLRVSKVMGTQKQRLAALREKADLYIINRENVVWLVSHYGGGWPFDTVVIDELSSFKSAKSSRFKALRMVRPKIRRIIGLTGTPSPNGYIDLWPQLYLLDQGERLGKTLGEYRRTFFNEGLKKGHVVYNYTLKSDPWFGAQEYEKEIFRRIGDICISMKSKDWLELPPRINRTVKIRLSPSVQAQYDDFEKKMVLALNDEDEITALGAAALSNKLLQFANGALYDEDKKWHEVHQVKLEALEEILEEADGKPVLVFYSYKSDVDRIMDHFRKYKPRKMEDSKVDIPDWNKGKIKLFLLHPASAGHGLNLQAGGNIIVWFGLPWSLELYQQANARLDRQGQKKSVIVHHLVASKTMDQDVMLALDRKEGKQEALMQAVKARIEKHSKSSKIAI